MSSSGFQFWAYSNAVIGRLTPSAWAIAGLQSILLHSGGIGSVLVPGGILLAFSALAYGLAIWRFQFETV